MRSCTLERGIQQREVLQKGHPTIKQYCPLLQERDILNREMNFIKYQREDETLSWAYDQLLVVNGEVIDSQQAEQYTHFELKAWLLYQLEKE